MGYSKLLLHGDGDDGSQTIIDSSAVVGKTVTAVGNAQIDTAQKVFGTGSILFDGTGDYLSLADSNDWNFGSGNFTIDFWVRIAALGESHGLFSLTQSTTEHLDIDIEANDRPYFSFTDGVGTGYGGGAISQDTWFHLAVVRNGNTMTCYRDGTSVKTFDCTGKSYDSLGTGIWIGCYHNTGYAMNGWIDEFRISKGVARWTANFTPPTSAYADYGVDDFITYTINVNDSITSVDFKAKSASLNKVYLDTLTLQDLISLARRLGITVKDNISLTDLVDVILIFPRNLNDRLSLNEKDFTITYTDKDIIEISTDPQIQAGTHGQFLSLQYVIDYPKLRWIDGRGLKLFKGKDFTMNSGSIINFIYDSANSVWNETSRMQNIGVLDGEG